MIYTLDDVIEQDLKCTAGLKKMFQLKCLEEHLLQNHSFEAWVSALQLTTDDSK
jgi:hypothetical protein